MQRPSTPDYLVAGSALALALSGMLISPDDAGPGALVLTVAQAVPLVYRRHAPGPVLVVVLAATVAYFVIEGPFVTTAFLGLVVAVYAIAAYGSERTARIGVAATGMGVLLLFVVDAALGRDVNAMDAIAYLGLVGIAWVLGDRAKTRRAYTRSLEERADQAERAREMETAAAAAAERTRIARELHDVVAHSVSTMVLHAAAAKQVLDGDPQAARDSLDLIEDTGRGAVGELRTVLHALRADEDGGDEELRPQPGVTAVTGLVERARAAGIEVDSKVEGAAQPLPASVDMSAYRIVQEALTNTLKHSGARRAEVVIRYSGDQLLIHVTDDGRGPPEGSTDAGFGLAGMRERVELLGGRIHAGARNSGGFEVLAVLPIKGGIG